MVIFWTILWVAIIALIFGAILPIWLGRRGPGPASGLLFFFIVLFLGIWALGSWIRPIGPNQWGVPWLSFLLVGLVLLFFIAAMTPARPDRRRLPPAHEKGPPAEPDKTETPITNEHAVGVDLAFGFFFWILLLFLILAIVFAFWW